MVCPDGQQYHCVLPLVQNDEPGIELSEQYSPVPQVGADPEQRPFTIV
jgi:hypothetical protein